MADDIGIGMAGQALMIIKLDTPQNQFAIRGKRVNIKSDSASPFFHYLLGQNKVFGVVILILS
jgi:hypothetical protein